MIGAFVVFTAVNDAMSPDPVADNPIDGVSFVQSNCVPLTFNADVNGIAVIDSPLHNV